MVDVIGPFTLGEVPTADRAASFLLFQLVGQMPPAQRRGPLRSLPIQQPGPVLGVGLVSLPQVGVAMQPASSLLVFSLGRAPGLDASFHRRLSAR